MNCPPPAPTWITDLPAKSKHDSMFRMIASMSVANGLPPRSFEEVRPHCTRTTRVAVPSTPWRLRYVASAPFGSSDAESPRHREHLAISFCDGPNGIVRLPLTTARRPGYLSDHRN